MKSDRGETLDQPGGPPDSAAPREDGNPDRSRSVGRGNGQNRDSDFSRGDQRNRGYPTNHHKRRRDDDEYYRGGRDWGGSRSASRGNDARYHRSSRGTGRDKGVSRSRDRSQSWSRSEPRFRRPYGPGHPSFETSDTHSERGGFRRGRSNSRSRFEFPGAGRFRSMSKSKSPGRSRLLMEGREWPPCFDTEGADYVFDSRSSMFYEAKSNFFYDPKTKLYYGNKKKAYFKYDEDSDPPFVEVEKTVQSQDGNNNEDVLDLIPATDAKKKESSDPEKLMIAIKLKTKKIKKAKVSSTAPVSNPVSKAAQEQVANIEKWTEKKAELKAAIEGGARIEPNFEPSTIKRVLPVIGSGAQSTVNRKVKMTAKGEPICWVCKRKFPNLDKLSLHERASELHKKNLEKLKASEAEKEAERQANYQDRAEKRRQLHGPQSSQAAIDVFKSGTVQTDLKVETLGSENIGNKLLKKMGWETKANVGPKEGDEEIHGNLRKEWDKIEELAARDRPGPHHK